VFDGTVHSAALAADNGCGFAAPFGDKRGFVFAVLRCLGFDLLCVSVRVEAAKGVQAHPFADLLSAEFDDRNWNGIDHFFQHFAYGITEFYQKTQIMFV
jgi:hypothetical protein